MCCFHVSGDSLLVPPGDRSPAARGSWAKALSLPNDLSSAGPGGWSRVGRDNGVKRCLGSNALRQPRIGQEFRVPRRGKGHEGREWEMQRLNCPSRVPASLPGATTVAFSGLGAWRLEGILSCPPPTMAHLASPAGMKGVGKGNNCGQQQCFPSPSSPSRRPDLSSCTPPKPKLPASPYCAREPLGLSPDSLHLISPRCGHPSAPKLRP